MKKIFLALFILFDCLFLQTSCSNKNNNYSDGLVFALSNDKDSYALVSSGTCYDNEIIIPSKYKGLPVSSIGNNTFYGCIFISSIEIPSSIISIGEYAFYNCSSLTSIAIPNSVTSIGIYAFGGCSSLQYNEYDNCLYLGNEENPYFALVEAKDTSIIEATIHSNTKVIADSAFSFCRSLISITIPNSVTSI